MRNLSSYKEKMRLDLFEYISNMGYVIEQYKELQEKPFASVLNLGITETTLNDAIKGLLILDRKRTDVSDEVLKMIYTTAQKSHGNNKVNSIHTLEVIESNIHDEVNNKEALFRFLETAHLSQLIFEMGYILSGDGLNFPKIPLLFIIDPDKVTNIIETDEEKFMEGAYAAICEILEKESNGEQIFKKLSGILNAYIPNGYKATA